MADFQGMKAMKSADPISKRDRVVVLNFTAHGRRNYGNSVIIFAMHLMLAEVAWPCVGTCPGDELTLISIISSEKLLYEEQSIKFRSWATWLGASSF